MRRRKCKRHDCLSEKEILRYTHEKYHTVQRYIKDIMERYVSGEYAVDETVEILDYFMCIVKGDLEFDYKTRILYKGPMLDFDKERFYTPLDFEYCDEKGKEHQTHKNYIGKKKIYFLENTTILSTPWNNKRLNRAIILSKTQKFEFDDTNHKSYYYKPLDFVYVYNGYHSSSAFSSRRKGFLISDEIDLTPMFPHVKTNGTHWISVHTNEVLGEIKDFRIAVLFELCKTKQMLQTASARDCFSWLCTYCESEEKTTIL